MTLPLRTGLDSQQSWDIFKAWLLAEFDHIAQIPNAQNAKGAWATDTAYNINDYVVSSGATYACMLSHTSGVFATDMAEGKWALFDNTALRADLAAEGGANRVGAQIIGDGITDKSAVLFAANALGHPISIKGVMVIGTATTITVPIMDTIEQIFSTSAQVTINNGLPVRPEWFGSAAGNIRLAVNALPATGGTILLRNTRYPPSYNTGTAAMVANGSGTAGLDYHAKPNVTFLGAGMPTVNAEMTGMIDGSGTIINGPFGCYAAGMKTFNFGVDSGSTVCTALYAGVAQNGFAHSQINKAAPSYVGGQIIDNILGLCQSSSALVHAVLLEAMDGFTVGYIKGVYGTHGVVIKSKNGTARVLEGFNNDSNCVIIKSEDYANCSGVIVDTAIGDTSLDACVRIQAATALLECVKVGKVKTNNGAIGLVYDGADISSDVSVGSLSTYGCAKGVRRVNQTRACRIVRAQINNATIESYEDVSGIVTFPFSFGSLEILNCAAGIVTAGKVVIDNYLSTGTTGYDFSYSTVGARIVVGMVGRVSPGQPGITSVNPVLTNGWASYGAGTSSFGVTLERGGLAFKGFLNSSSGSLFNLTTQMRPSQTISLPIHGFHSVNGMVISMLEIATNGDVGIVSPTRADTWWNIDGAFIPSSFY